MISSVCWIPRGAARSVPIMEEISQEELTGIRDKNEEMNSTDEEDEFEEDDIDEDSELADADVNPENPASRAAAVAMSITGNTIGSKHTDLADELAELDMDNYENEDTGELRLFGNGGLGAAYYKNPGEDPYLTANKAAGGVDDEEEAEEADDLMLRPSDLLLLTARNEDDVSHVEVWVCEEEDEGEGDEEEEGRSTGGNMNLYVHHDIMLPAFPLCLAWMDCSLSQHSGKKSFSVGEGKDDEEGEEAAAVTASRRGNLVAVGTMEPVIEIWDLDVLDAVEPIASLGGLEEEGDAEAEGKKTKKNKKPKKKKKKARPFKAGSHTDSVLGLAWNAEFRNVLASGSADCRVKVWDVATQSCQHTLSHHTDKVQAVSWNPREPTVLLSGAFDHTAAVADMRVPDHCPLTWKLSADVECLAWDPHASHSFVVSTEDGFVRCYDVRQAATTGGSTAAVYSLHAHEKATCAVSFNPATPDLLATASTDKMVKLWDTTGGQPSCLASTNPKLGAIFSIGFCKDSPHLLAMGGSKGELHVWNTLSNSAVAKRVGKSSIVQA